jgi:hypothetical protein
MFAKDGIWRDFILHEGRYQWQEGDFQKFIEADRSAGCQSSLDILERAIRGTDAWEVYQKLIKPG